MLCQSQKRRPKRRSTSKSCKKSISRTTATLLTCNRTRFCMRAFTPATRMIVESVPRARITCSFWKSSKCLKRLPVSLRKILAQREIRKMTIPFSSQESLVSVRMSNFGARNLPMPKNIFKKV